MNDAVKMTGLFLLLMPSTPSPVAAQAAPNTDTSVQQLATDVRAAITPAALEQHTRAIVQHERPSGSVGENAAIDYIVTTLRTDGVPVDVYEFEAYASDPVSARVEIVDAHLIPKAITVAFSRSVQGLEGRLVDVGSASSLPAVDVATGEGLSVAESTSIPDLNGAIALVDGLPLPGPAWKLERLGAAGAIFVNPEERLNDLIVTTVWGTPSLLNVHRIPRLAVAEVRRDAGEVIRHRLAQGRVRVRLTTEVKTAWKPLRLAVARVPAPDPEAPLVLFGGHIDGWYHAGTDEGASNAAMLALATAFYQNRAALLRSLVVAWWPGHSNGRYAGSTWFADHFFSELMRRGLAYVNVDGIGQTGAQRFGVRATSSLAELAEDVVRQRVGQEVEPSRPGRNSDMAFNGIGLPVLQITHNRLAEDGGYWWWHTPDDTFDKVDFQILKTDTDLYADALAALLAAPVVPIDLVAEVEALGELVSRWESLGDGRFDLTEVRSRQRQLLDAVRRIKVREAETPASESGIDLALVGILRPLHRVVYTLAGAHHPDPAVDPGLLPGLAPVEILAREDPTGDRYRFAEATLVRERNRLVEALDEAIDEAERLRERLGGS